MDGAKRENGGGVMLAFDVVKNPYFAIPLIISIVFGVISTLAFLQQRKKYKAQDYLFGTSPILG